MVKTNILIFLAVTALGAAVVSQEAILRLAYMRVFQQAATTLIRRELRKEVEAP